MSIEQILLDLIRDASEPRHEICKGAGVDASVLSRFVSGQRRELSLSTVQRLLDYFDLQVG